VESPCKGIHRKLSILAENPWGGSLRGGTNLGSANSGVATPGDDLAPSVQTPDGGKLKDVIDRYTSSKNIKPLKSKLVK
jgi:hypothetical protein